MNKTFCTSCGNKMEYPHVKPKFCSDCGTSLGSARVNPHTSKPTYQEPEEEYEEEIELDSSNIKIDIELNPIRGVTLQEAVSNGSKENYARQGRREKQSYKKYSKALFADKLRDLD